MLACALLERLGVKARTRRVEGLPTRLLLALVTAIRLAGSPAGAAEPAPVDAGPPARSWGWRLAAQPGTAANGALSVAAGPGGVTAVGDASGVLLPDEDGIWRRLALPGAVRDVAFAPDGSLWIASDAGLYRLAGHRLETPTPAPGDAARLVLRVVATERAVVVATEEGVHWSRDGRRFARVEGAFGTLGGRAAAGWDREEDGSEVPSVLGTEGEEHGALAPARAGASPREPEIRVGLALVEPDDPAAPATLWIAAERGLFRAQLTVRDGAARVRAVPVRTPIGLRPAIDVAAGPWGVLALGDGPLLEGDPGGRHWRVHRPELPPGASPTRLLVTPSGVWIASDRGVLEAAHPGASWTRADEPAGSLRIAALADAGGRLLAAGERGLLVGEPNPPAESVDPRAAEVASASRPGSASWPPRAAACDPPIADVRRAVLRHLELGGERIRRLWDGVNKRAWLPVVTLDGSYGNDRIRTFRRDEAFISSDFRVLHDRDRDSRRDRDLSLRLVWDLRDLVYHDEQIDVSTEMRRTIELRDDVLDEVHQLYFDRRRLLLALTRESDSGADGSEERVRAEELAAGLDGWTGGWFGPRAGTEPCSAGLR